MHDDDVEGADPDEASDPTLTDPTSLELDPPTNELRIHASPTGVAAGLVTQPPAPSEAAEAPSEVPEDASEIFELPNWADPPTGQVPRVLLEQSDSLTTAEVPRGPTWRQESEDFGDDHDFSFLLPDEGLDETIAGNLEPTEKPFEFSFAEDDPREATVPLPVNPEGDEAAWNPLFDEGARRRSASAQRRRHSARRQRRVPAPAKSAVTAILTGLILGAVALGCFLLGAISTEILVVAGTVIAAGEAFAVLQGVGYRPATLIGLLAVPALVLGAYLHGPLGIVVVLGVAFVLLGVWFLSPKSGDEPLVNLAVSLLVICWLGLLGAFAGLLLAPAGHPHRHGVALVVAVIVLTVAHDIGSYAVGAKLGRHLLAPRISPGKTVEGLLGGTVLCLVVAVLVVARIHPIHLGTALGLGVVVVVLAPLGDLLESRVKRDLGVKDMGSVLPSHGGVFDRIDAMLFVLPAAFVLFRITHLG